MSAQHRSKVSFLNFLRVHKVRMLSQVEISLPWEESLLGEDVAVVEPKQIISHVVADKVDKGLWGLDRDFYIVCTNLNRGRK